jgi:hypothetical protein
MLSPSLAEIEVARRVLQTIDDNGHPAQADAITLRLCVGPRNIQGLEEIAMLILETKYPKMRKLRSIKLTV